MATLVTLVAGAAALAGCSSHEEALPEDYGHQWMSQMSSQLSGDFGGGGGQLVLVDDNSKKATLGVELQQDLEGPYDVLAVCRSAEIVHVSLYSFTVKKDGNGDSTTLREHLGEADIYCGSTTRIPIDMPKNRAGIDIEASTNDRSERALFDSFIVKHGDRA
ncbi:hypothetical protein Q9Q99_14010 [Curtobacterium flaccumfaciens]|nr:hypothetical protein Q9Q99_14010 [Curtobacterium flaccumfaciens]